MMKLGMGLVGLCGLWTASAAWAMGTFYVARAEAPVVSAPNEAGAAVGRLSLGAKLETGEKRRGFLEITFEGKQAWVRASALSKKAPSDRALCARGRRALSVNNLTAAVLYLRSAADAGTKRRECLAALADAYRRRAQLDDEATVRARIRRLDRWLPGTWCDASQRLVLALGDDGRYSFKSGETVIGGGKYELRQEELLLDDDGAANRKSALTVTKRGLGRILITANASELQRDFCQAPQ